MAWWGPRYSGAVVIVSVAGLEEEEKWYSAPTTERLEMASSYVCGVVFIGRKDMFSG